MHPQRLPIIGGDDGTWGNILSKYLEKEHFNDGSNNPHNGGHKNVTIRAGSSLAGGAPLKFTSGTLLTTPEAGAVEFTGDTLYVTQTSSSIRKKIAIYDDTNGASGDIYYRTGSGYFTPLPIGDLHQILTVENGIPAWRPKDSNFSDTTFTLHDEDDATKKMQLQLSGIAPDTTRTITIPDSSGTLYITGSTDVAVADGGTGRSTSLIPYGIIAAGTMATSAQQTITPGAAGQFLKSAGSAALASFSAITAADITGTIAQFNSALTDNDFVTLTGTETLTNKTINMDTNTVTGLPYDLSIVAFGTYTVRAASSYGDFPFGTKLQRNVQFTQAVYRVNTPDSSGELVVELRRNGNAIAGSSATIAAANQVTGGTATGTWVFAAGDILTVYVTGVGDTPGAGLIADIRGVTT